MINEYFSDVFAISFAFRLMKLVNSKDDKSNNLWVIWVSNSLVTIRLSPIPIHLQLMTIPLSVETVALKAIILKPYDDYLNR